MAVVAAKQAGGGALTSETADQAQLVAVQLELNHGVEHAAMRFAVDRWKVGKEVVKVR